VPQRQILVISWSISASVGFRREQRRRRHDHAGLAVAALRHVMIEPSLLHPVQGAVLSQPFNRGDLLALGCAHRQRARAHRRPVDVNGAGAALRDAAAILGAGQADLFPQCPQQRGVGVDADLVRFSINGETDHPSSPWFVVCCRHGRLILAPVAVFPTY
jgi:hypothetical protein